MKPDRTQGWSRKPRMTPRTRAEERSVEQDPVEVFCRIRPPELPEQEECINSVDHYTIKLTPPLKSFAFRNGNRKEQFYKFQQVFSDNSSQKEIFDRIAKPLVADLLARKNGLLFAYGVTGSGKTYTMQGTPQDGGIIPRTLDVIFNSIQELQTKSCIFKPDGMNGFDGQSESDAFMDRRKLDATPTVRSSRTPRFRRDDGQGSQNSSQRIPDTSRIESIDEDNVYSVFVSYIEIYNNYLYDLLEELPDTGPARNLQTKILREDALHNMYVHSCTEVEVKSPVDALEVLHRGQKRRKVAYTRLNCESSRSHSIFNIRVVQAPLDEDGEEVVTDRNAVSVSQLSLVDLAGSERNVRTKVMGDRIKEAGNINNSLMNLRNCIEILRENQLMGSNKKVPYRDYKLTHIFKNYFDGDGCVKMIVCINPKAEDYDETVTVMKFAELASEVQIQRHHIQPLRDLGFTPGRRRANQLFKMRQKLEDEVPSHKEIDLSPLYCLAPDWPSVTHNPQNENEIISKLKTYLVKRNTNKEKLRADVREKIFSVRSNIMGMESDNLVMTKKVESIQSLYHESLSNTRELETQLRNAEAANDSLMEKLKIFHNLKSECQVVREERDMAKLQSHIQKQRMKTQLKSKLEQEKQRLKQDMNIKLSKQKSKIFHNQVKALQEMLLDDKEKEGDTQTNVPSTPSSNIDPPLLRPRSNSEHRSNTSKEMPDLSGPAVVNLRHRRSRSQGADLWLDHRPAQEVPTGTVMQPNLPRRKSVTRLRSEDLANVQGYCLTTQRQDAYGELETKLYKGNIVPTAGGGTQVVFQDVEVLKQRDPLTGLATPSRKRSSDGTPKVNGATVKERCAMGIQAFATPLSHTSTKRSKY